MPDGIPPWVQYRSTARRIADDVRETRHAAFCRLQAANLAMMEAQHADDPALPELEAQAAQAAQAYLALKA